MAQRELELITRLKEKTDSRTLAWEPSAVADEFVAVFRGDVSFTISRHDDPNSFGDSYRLVMRDNQNREMLTLTNRNAFSEAASALESLYLSAKNAALKVDETVDSILEDLRKVS